MKMYNIEYIHIFMIITVILASGVQSAAVAKVEDDTNVSNDFYIESQRKANWYQAFSDCSARHMSLAVLDTKEKADAVIVELKKVFGSNHPNIWIGGNDEKKTRHFVWTATNEAFGYTNWSPGQPDNKGGVEHCVMLWDSHNYRWNDGNCRARVAYVCEKRK